LYDSKKCVGQEDKETQVRQEECIKILEQIDPTPETLYILLAFPESYLFCLTESLYSLLVFHFILIYILEQTDPTLFSSSRFLYVYICPSPFFIPGVWEALELRSRCLSILMFLAPLDEVNF